MRIHIFIFIILLCSLTSYGTEAPLAKQGVMSLGQWDYQQDPMIELDGEWEFYWMQLIGPEEEITTIPIFVLPTKWNDYEIDGEKLKSNGYATYRVTIRDLPDEPLTLVATPMQTAYRVYLNDALVVEVGAVGTDEDSSEPMNREVLLDLPSGLSEVLITVQVSNFHHRKGAFNRPFKFGIQEAVKDYTRTYTTLSSMQTAVFGIIGLFFLALYAFRRKDGYILYFALFCITMAFRPIISVYYLLASLIPDINWYLMVKLEYLSMFLSALFFTLFIKSLFPDQFPPWIVKFFTTVFLIMTTVIIITSPSVYSWLTIPLQFIIPVGVVIFIVVTIRAITAKVDSAIYAGLGLFIMMISVIIKVLDYSEIIPPSTILITVLDIAFTFMMSMILGSRFAIQFKKVEVLQVETEQQRSKIVEQKKEVDNAFDQLEEKNKEIVDSINYSKRIQDAILPPIQNVKEHLPNSFIFYRPKDIVAGDFYWMEPADGLTLFAAADCTGHGVPGALLSMLCNNALNRSVREYALREPGKILDMAREIIIKEFEKYNEEVKDGMDIALCSLNGRKLQFAGAYNPLWIFRNGEIIETRGNKQPIGLCDGPLPFTTHTFDLEEGDAFYIFSDGYVDQFGGPKGKKFKSRAFKELLLSIQDKPMETQHDIIDKGFIDWKGDLDQIDDVCVIGVKV